MDMDFDSSMKSSDSIQHLVGKPTKLKPPTKRGMLPAPVTVTGFSFVSTFWFLSTFVLIGALVIAGTFPNWIVNDVESTAQKRELDTEIDSVQLGLYHMCYNLTFCNSTTCSGYCRNNRFCGCYLYSQYDPPLQFVPSNINRQPKSTNLFKASVPSDIPFLVAAGIIYGVGIGLFMVSLLVGALACCKPRIRECSVFLAAFVLQAMGGE